MILVHLKPYMVKIKFWDKEEVDYVLNKYFDSELIKFIEENNLQVGDNVIEKQQIKNKRMEQITQLKQLRVDLDALKLLVIQTAIKAQGGVSEEMMDSNFNVKMAKAYVGKLLGSIGDPIPYKNNGKREVISDIEPEDAIASKENMPNILFDSNGDFISSFSNSSYIAKVDTLRELIESHFIKPISEMVTTGFSKDANIYRTQVFVCLTDARLHLGFELGRLRQEKNGLK